MVYARRLSEILGTRWEQVPLGDFHRYLDEWDKLFGVSTHAHGMYHFEFYENMLPKLAGSNPFLSGIIGDAWAGGVNIPAVGNCVDVRRLGHSHGINADSAQSHFPVEQSLLPGYWEIQKNRLEDLRFRVVEAMRFKLILLCYLKIVPSVFGFQWWSPFLDIDIAMAMLNLPLERKRDCLWQKEFFQRQGLDLESMGLKVSYQNTLDLQALRRIPVTPLDAGMLREVVRPEYVECINRNLVNRPFAWTELALNRLLRVRKVGGALRRMGFVATNRQTDAYNAYNAYIVLLPIEKLLKRRNLA